VCPLGGKMCVHCQDKAQQWNGRGGRPREGVRGGGRGYKRGSRRLDVQLVSQNMHM